MPTNVTYKIRDLQPGEIQELLQEISSISTNEWIKHFKIPNKLLSLNDGESIHINWPANNEFLRMPEKSHLVPNILKIINLTLGDKKLGRAYIHRLKPGDCIEKHHDKINIESMNIQHRYHIYFEIPNESVLCLDDQNIIDKEKFQFSIVEFALGRVHYYQNRSDQNWYFVVFDSI